MSICTCQNIVIINSKTTCFVDFKSFMVFLSTKTNFYHTLNCYMTIKWIIHNRRGIYRQLCNLPVIDLINFRGQKESWNVKNWKNIFVFIFILTRDILSEKTQHTNRSNKNSQLTCNIYSIYMNILENVLTQKIIGFMYLSWFRVCNWLKIVSYFITSSISIKELSGRVNTQQKKCSTERIEASWSKLFLKTYKFITQNLRLRMPQIAGNCV